MKTSLLGVLFILTSLSSYAASLEHYINKDTLEVVEVSSKNTESPTIKYFSYREGKRIESPSEKLSKEINSDIAGISANKLILVQTDEELKTCNVYRVFENSMAQIGCRRLAKGIYQDSPPQIKIDLLILQNVDSLGVIAEVESLNGFKKDAVATLNVAVGSLKAETVVKILSVFADGEALVEKSGYRFMESKVTLLRTNIERVNLVDLVLN